MTTEQLATRFSDITPPPAIWTWGQRVPVAELTILAAPGGTGKGILCADLAARIARGRAARWRGRRAARIGAHGEQRG